MRRLQSQGAFSPSEGRSQGSAPTKEKAGQAAMKKDHSTADAPGLAGKASTIGVY